MASVLILGGGFGGLAAAHELRRRLTADHEISLLAANDRFFVGYAKLWDLVGTRPLEQGTGHLSSLDGQGIHFTQAVITAIDPGRRAVETSAGPFAADFMIVALGAGSSLGKLGSPAPSAYDLYDPDALPTMRQDLDQLTGGRVLVPVLGLPYVCPPAPYEAAFLVEEHLRQRGVREQTEVAVTTPMPATLPMAGREVSTMVADALRERGIELLTSHDIARVDTVGKTVFFDGGEAVDYTLLLGVPEATPLAIVAESSLAGDEGWIWPDRQTGRTTFSGVYAVGDCTAVENLPRAGVFAEAMGRVAAANIVADITGSAPDRYDGSGYCFLEFPGHRASALEGDFFAQPRPVVRMAEPSAEVYARKEAFEAERLREWFGNGQVGGPR